MQNALIQITNGNLAPGYCYPSSPQTFLNDIVALLIAYLPGNYSTFNLGPTTPSVDDQDKPWIKTDSSGNLVGLFTFGSGAWVRPHPVPPSSQQRIIWAGSDSDLWSFDGGDGSNPITTPPTSTTGAMWVRDTAFGSGEPSDPNAGANGVNVFKVPIGAGLNPTAYDQTSAKSIAVGDVGGEERVALTQSQMPPHTHGARMGFHPSTTDECHGWDNASVGGFGADTLATQVQVAAGDTGAMSAANQSAGYPITIAGGNGATPAAVVSHNNLPNYKGVIFAKRTARVFLVG